MPVLTGGSKGPDNSDERMQALELEVMKLRSCVEALQRRSGGAGSRLAAAWIAAGISLFALIASLFALLRHG